MGRDYWHGAGKGVRGEGVGGGRRVEGGSNDPTVATGCMSSVFRFFDFHHFQLCYHLNHHHQQQHGNLEHLDSLSSTPQSLKGLEAPRNSVESLDGFQTEPACSISNPLSENLNIRLMSVKTKRTPLKTDSIFYSEELSEDGYSSPGSRTPSLVARLMGLELLPEAASPAFSTSSIKIPLPHTQLGRKQMKNSGTQSLPESPRISLARWSDVDLHHRLSLQVNNKAGNKEDEALCRRREMIKSLVQNSEADGWSPGHYAKQIVKQVKESVVRSRRVGLTEITNKVKGRETTELRRDEHLLPPEVKIKIKTKTTSPSLSSKNTSQKKAATNYDRCDEDVENQAPINTSNTQKHLPVSPSTSWLTPAGTKRETTNLLNEKKTTQKLKCRKAVEDKFKFTTCSTPATKAIASSKNKKTESESLSIVRPISPSPTANQGRKKSPLMPERTPLSTKQFSIATTATRTGLHRNKQVVVPSDNQKVQQQLQLKKQKDSTEAKTQTVGGQENIGQYVSKILKCMGIGNHTRINTISNWFSPSNPLNPSIFDLLEPISSTSNLIPQCNRRLIFQLTDEILTDIMRPTTGSDIMRVMQMNGNQLVKLLTSKMESFPLSNCQDLQDVDGLVGSDYDRIGWLYDESRSVVRELEREILDCLLFETAALL